MITDSDMPEGYLLERATPESLFIVDRDDQTLQLYAELEDGEIWFSVRTVDETGMKHTLRGATLYELMLRHFGTSVVAIAGFWPTGENLRVFRECLALGHTPEDAARATWSGRQAVRHGFANVEFDWCGWPEIPQNLGLRFRRKDAGS